MGFKDIAEELYPRYLPENDFLERTHDVLKGYGFNSENTIACVGVCRDEITRTFIDSVHDIWGDAFNFCSLAGMLFLGRTGFRAALNHAPTHSGPPRYVFIAMPHIAIDAEGRLGVVYREGQAEESGACGALQAFRKELQGGHLMLETDRDDIEQSILKQRLFGRIRYGEIPDMVTLTRITYETIIEDLERMIAQTVDSTICSYSVITGIQIHGPEQNYVWPQRFYCSVRQVRTDLEPAI